MDKQNDLIEKLMKDTLTDLATADEILEREVMSVGNGAHINIPKKHIGKMAKIIIRKKNDSREELIDVEFHKKEGGNS